MSKTLFYRSQCVEAASKSPMCFTLGACLVKGGKIISTGYNHHRPHYDGADAGKRGHRKPVSMHAEMHAIFTATGMSPAFKKQVAGVERLPPPCDPQPPPKGSAGSSGDGGATPFAITRGFYISSHSTQEVSPIRQEEAQPVSRIERRLGFRHTARNITSQTATNRCR
jgi:hypothetical protein